MEILEYYNENNTKKIGEIEREYIHINNLWHREIAVVVINENKEILLQKRSLNKKQYPNKYSFCAGHVEVLETPKHCAVRELFEETGIQITEEDLIYIDTFKCEHKENNHFKYTYLVYTNMKINEMVIQEEEVSELKYVSIQELEKLIDAKDNNLTFADKYYAPIILEFVKEYVY